jgi:hypothetical protein
VVAAAVAVLGRGAGELSNSGAAQRAAVVLLVSVPAVMLVGCLGSWVESVTR